MSIYQFEPKALDPVTREFYRDVLSRLNDAEVPFLVGGAFAMAAITGIVRQTKDLDLFVPPESVERVLEVGREAGYAIERTCPMWIAKVLKGDAFVDIIYRSGNSLSEVSEQWFEHAIDATLLGLPVKLCAPEETLWSKAFIMERERYDGADVAHYLLAWSSRMDWPRLLAHFGPHWRVLLSHLILFGFIYPEHRSLIPTAVMDELFARARREREEPDPRGEVCKGTYLSRAFYLVDVSVWGYRDPRFEPHGSLSETALKSWRSQLESETPKYLRETGISQSDSSSRPVLH